jgi:hypothetical protein
MVTLFRSLDGTAETLVKHTVIVSGQVRSAGI